MFPGLGGRGGRILAAEEQRRRHCGRLLQARIPQDPAGGYRDIFRWVMLCDVM